MKKSELRDEIVEFYAGLFKVGEQQVSIKPDAELSVEGLEKFTTSDGEKMSSSGSRVDKSGTWIVIAAIQNIDVISIDFEPESQEGGKSEEELPLEPITDFRDQFQNTALLAIEDLASIVDADEVEPDANLLKPALREFIILLIRIKSDGVTGKELIYLSDQMFNVEMSPGKVYPILHQMKDEDKIKVINEDIKERPTKYKLKNSGDELQEFKRQTIQHLVLSTLFAKAMVTVEQEF